MMTMTSLRNIHPVLNARLYWYLEMFRLQKVNFQSFYRTATAQKSWFVKKQIPLLSQHQLQLQHTSSNPSYTNKFSALRYYCTDRTTTETQKYSDTSGHDNKKKLTLAHEIDSILDQYKPSTELTESTSFSVETDQASTSSTSTTKVPTLEKQLQSCMTAWEIDEGVALLKNALRNGQEPDRTILLKLLNHIAQIGEVEMLLDLYQTELQARNLVSIENFYMCLSSALYASGRIAEGIDMLDQFHRNGLDVKEFDIFFTLLGTTIVREFENRIYLLEECVERLESAEPPLMASARALLWKCYVLAGKFDRADDIRLNDESLKKLIPAQVTFIVQSSASKSFLAFDKESVLHWLVSQVYLKGGLRATALHKLVQLKSEEEEWQAGLGYITEAMEMGVQVQKETLTNFLSAMFGQMPQEKLEFWENLIGYLRELKLEDYGGDKDDNATKHMSHDEGTKTLSCDDTKKDNDKS